MTNLQLAQKNGTPIYIYRSEIIKTKISNLRDAFGSLNHNIHYACKANSNIALLEYLLDSGIGLDTVSMEEVALGIKLGFQPEDILYTPSFPSIEDLNTALSMDLKVHINSLEYIPFLDNGSKPIHIGIRINPEIEVDLNKKTATSHVESKFGIPISKIENLKLMCRDYQISIDGLHIHVGSGVSNWEDFKQPIDLLFNLVKDFPSLKYIDIGGGYKIKYKSEDKALDIVSLANYIKQKIKKLDHPIAILLEPGKYLVGESGVFIAKVEMVKEGVNTKFAGLNAGFNHLFRPMYYDAYHEIVNLSNANGVKEKYDIVGYLCEEDTFAYSRLLPQINRGDFLLFNNAGAYGYSMSSNYNLRIKPKELFI